MQKKILFLITKSEIGGAQKYVLDLADGAKRAGFDVAIASQQNSHLYETLLKHNIRFIEVRHLQRDIDPILELQLAWELYKIIKKEKPDILHLNSSKVGALGALIGKLAGAPKIIFTAHGWAFNDPRPPLQLKVITFISRFAARFQDKIICVSKYDRRKALEFKIAPAEKIITIHNGINAKKIELIARDEAREKLKLDKKDFVIGTIANFYKTKALDTIVLSAISAVHENSNIKFILIGDGPEMGKIEALIQKYKLDEYFILPGMIKNASNYLKAFDIFVMPSKKEGLPYALLEAMAAKVLCVVSAVGGMPEIISNEQNGILIRDMTPGKLQETITKLAENKLKMKEMAKAGQQTVLEEFSLKRMVEETLDVYES